MLLLCVASCSSEVYRSTLENKTQFDSYAGPPLTDKYNEVKAVKVVYDLRNQKIYYLNHKRFKLHHEFCSYLRGYELDAYTFNEHNYRDSESREYLLGNINYLRKTDQYVLELSPTDRMPPEQILRLYKEVEKSTYFGERFSFLLNSAHRLADREALRSKVRLMTTAQMYGSITYQPIYKTSATGHLRFVKESELKNTKLKTTDILILDHTPLLLPDVAGVIVAELQTPLSHLTILGQNRKIPICAVVDAFENVTLRLLQDSLVLLNILSDTYEITPTDKLTNNKHTLPQLKLRADVMTRELIDAEKLNNKNRHAVGNKAANFGMLQKLSKKRDFRVPEGAFAIPFYYYHEHMMSSGAQLLLDEFLRLKLADPKIQQDKLKEIREAIKEHTVSHELIASIASRMSKDSLYHRMRFRSSTNAEDEDGFSGAGLYQSKTGILHHDTKTIERALKLVWASLWSDAAYLERTIFRMDQTSVYMGVLVHRSFPDEILNGVAITKNLYRTDNPGFVVNVQLGEHSVVKPDSGEVCDQFICFAETYISGVNKTVDIITTSSLADGELLMTEEEISLLANELYAIKRYFGSRSMLSGSYLNKGFDVEFKLYGAVRDLYIKQVRLYND